MLWPLRAAVRRLPCCGLRSHLKSFPCKLTLSVVRQAQQESRSGPWFCQAVQESQSSPMSLLLAPDIRSWTVSRMTSFSLATFSKGNKVPGVGFCPFFGMLRTAIFMPVLTLERWWTGSGTSSWWQRKGTSTLQCYTIVTKWWTPLPPQNGLQAQMAQFSHAVSLLVLAWPLTLFCWHKPEWDSLVEDAGKVSISSPYRSRMPRKKRPLQGRRWPSLEHSRYV